MSIDFSTLTEACKSIVDNPELFNNFKRNPGITKYFEHLGEESGRKYYDYLKDEIDFKFICEHNALPNDEIGNPIKFNYDGFIFSPTTLRYLKVWYDIIKYFGQLDFYNIVEIGGGYGGQCDMLTKKTNASKYTILDLTDVAKLQHKYLSIHAMYRYGVKILCTSAVNIIDNKIDLVISNYAYSELSKEWQEKYFLKVISRAERGYMTLNNINKEFHRDAFIQKMCIIKQCEIIKEDPNTGDNLILIWGHDVY